MLNLCSAQLKHPEMSGDENVLSVTSCQVEWTIKNFLRLPKDPAYYMYSKSFTFCDIEWRLYIYPLSERKPNSVSFGLERESSTTGDQCVNTTFGMKRTDGSVIYVIHEVLEFKADTKSITAGIIDRTPLFSSKDIWMPGGNLTIVCDVGLENNKAPKPAPLEKSHLNFIRDLEGLYLSEREADVTINIRGKSFKAHRCILVARSSVFATMFRHDMTEKNSGVVDIDDCDPDSFRDFLIYLYTGNTHHVTSGNAQGLYDTADKYAADELKVKCAKLMGQHFAIDSFCDVLLLASMHGEQELLNGATDFFIKNLKEILPTKKWVSFHSKHFTLVNELFMKIADHVKI